MRETYVLINCDLGKEQQIVNFLQKLQGIREVQATHGVYDIIAKIETRTGRELNDTIRTKILSLKQVNSVITLQAE
ncbi:Transcriptional regulator, AsnC family [Nitrosotalea devaniterrae]|uniref:Transcriptional regulator, AsnC family n=1 Tax=Nitrosotalea devaniterrae TaxID=1078905 RepID=A0A128A1C7_9ARCH|nr:Transcriptional regulator, AsnC family [Candidatus Nitrosotalea devanaterra]